MLIRTALQPAGSRPATSSSPSIAGRSLTPRRRNASWGRWPPGISRKSLSGAAMVKSSLRSRKISAAIQERGPLTVAAFMALALYDADIGYYARAPRRSGRAGDFFTSVDVGPLFGQLLEIQLAEMARFLCGESRIPNPESRFDLVEAGAGDGRLSADILRAAKRRDPAFYDSIRLHLVEASAAARAAQRETLGDLCDR